MPSSSQWVAFLLASVLFIQVPGPSLLFTIEPGVTLENGEINGKVGNSVRGPDGTLVENESGTYYAVLAGDANTIDSEVVGVLVVGHSLPNGITQRETGGFIVYRGAGN